MIDPEQKQLQSTWVDGVTSLSKSAIGVVPYAGTFFAEIVGHVIPNQRIDRIVRFIKKLDDRLRELEATLDERCNDPEVVDILEDSFFQAARAITDDRLDYIADMVANGLSQDELNFAEAKRMTWLLGQLEDVEIILLRSRLPRTDRELKKDQEFRTRHTNHIHSTPVHLGSSPEEREKDAIRTSYFTHLQRLGLLADEAKLTTLGRILLRYLNLLPDWG
ncbi:MAG: hypothetical protein ABI614_15525 [Planctomycetota bacterium]